MSVPGGSEGRESACNAGDLSSIPGSGRSPGEGNDNPLQYSCLENPMDRGDWRAAVHGVSKSQTWLSDSHLHFHISISMWLLLAPLTVIAGDGPGWVQSSSPSLQKDHWDKPSCGLRRKACICGRRESLPLENGSHLCPTAISAIVCDEASANTRVWSQPASTPSGSSHCPLSALPSL